MGDQKVTDSWQAAQIGRFRIDAAHKKTAYNSKVVCGLRLMSVGFLAAYLKTINVELLKLRCNSGLTNLLVATAVATSATTTATRTLGSWASLVHGQATTIQFGIVHLLDCLFSA